MSAAIAKGLLYLLFAGALLGVGYRAGKEAADRYYHGEMSAQDDLQIRCH